MLNCLFDVELGTCFTQSSAILGGGEDWYREDGSGFEKLLGRRDATKTDLSNADHRGCLEIRQHLHLLILVYSRAKLLLDVANTRRVKECP